MGKYTDSVPVLTEQRLAKIASHQWNFKVTDRVRLSSQPDVLAIYDAPEPELSVRVWRREFPQAVQDFVTAALEMLGQDAPIRFGRRRFVLLLDKKQRLMLRYWNGSQFHFTVNFFRKKYEGIPPDLVDAFANHFLTSVHNVLSQLPLGSYLEDRADTANSYYVKRPSHYPDIHTDADEIVLMHYSEPGTPYLVDYDWDSHKIKGSYRTQAGDVSIHGGSVEHSSASSRPVSDGAARLRLLQLFAIRHP